MQVQASIDEALSQAWLDLCLLIFANGIFVALSYTTFSKMSP